MIHDACDRRIAQLGAEVERLRAVAEATQAIVDVYTAPGPIACRPTSTSPGSIGACGETTGSPTRSSPQRTATSPSTTGRSICGGEQTARTNYLTSERKERSE